MSKKKKKKKKKKLHIVKASTGCVIATVEAEEREIPEIKRGIEKCLRRMLGTRDYKVQDELAH